MATASLPRLMTMEEFLQLPTDDGVDRMLIRGELWEKPMTRRNRFHSATESLIACLLWNWVRSRPEPRGKVYSGEVGVWLSRDPDTSVGIDVAYFSPERLAAAESDETTLLVGPPTLAVEILSPSDKIEELNAKIDAYGATGVPVAWFADPHLKTVTVYRPDRGPELLHGDAVLEDEAHLPGLKIVVAELFPGT